MTEFDKWWASQPQCFPAPSELEKSAAYRAWLARGRLDAALCRATDEPLDSSAGPEHFARAIEAFA